jgi:hypothetical protein
VFQPLGEQAQARAVPEDDLDEVGLAAAEDEQMTRERVLPQHLLDQQGQSVHPLAHVRVAIRQVHLHAGGEQGHGETSSSAPAASTISTSTKAGAAAAACSSSRSKT